MIVIETSLAVTVAVTVVASAISIAATWFFARRRYERTQRPEHSEMTGEQKLTLWIMVVLAVVIVLMLGMVFFATR